MIAKERICLTEEGCVVPDGHAAARVLLVGAGCEIEDKAARQYGIKNGRLPADWQKRLEQARAQKSAPAQKSTPKG